MGNMMETVAVLDKNGERVGEVAVSPRFAGAKANSQLIHDVIVSYARNRHRGTASTLTKGEVRGSGKKPWRQKGTGRARAGVFASPLWRGGGIVFGPKPKSRTRRIPEGMRRKALLAVLADKMREGQMVVVDTTEGLGPKTREVARWLARIGACDKPLIVTPSVDEGMRRGARNIAGADVVTQGSLNALMLMLHGKIVISRSDFEKIQERFL